MIPAISQVGIPILCKLFLAFPNSLNFYPNSTLKPISKSNFSIQLLFPCFYATLYFLTFGTCSLFYLIFIFHHSITPSYPLPPSFQTNVIVFDLFKLDAREELVRCFFFVGKQRIFYFANSKYSFPNPRQIYLLYFNLAF